MEIINLPEDIFSDPTELTDGIIIHPYTAKKDSFKGKSILSSNAISLVLTGEKTMHFAEKTVVIKDDEFHFLSSGNCLASMGLSRQGVFSSILLFFNDQILDTFYSKYAQLVSNYKASHAIAPERYIAFKKDAFIYNYIASLQLMFKSKKSISAAMKLLKFEELMLYLLEKYPAAILSFQSAHSASYGELKLRNVVETNITNNLSVEELAFLCDMSLSTFKRRFSKLYGTSPNKWLLQRKMAMAASLLQSKHTRPSDVFHQVGYENHSSFSHAFKQLFGVSPKSYQTQNGRLATRFDPPA